MPEAAAAKLRKSGAPVPLGFDSLLVAVDLTPSSDRILGRLSLLPLADDARVTLLHVVPGNLRPASQRRAARDANQALADEARHLRKQIRRKLRIEPLVKVGTAATEIAACAAAAKAELVVMGRGGGRALRDAFLGSTAERVIRQNRLPVLVVRLAPRRSYGRPALALDLDSTAHEIVRLMLRLLPPPRPQVEVIHAFDVPYLGRIYPSLSEDEVKQWKDEFRSNAKRELAGLLATALSKAGVRPGDAPVWRPHVRHGRARIVVEKAIRRAETDLLVLGTHARSGPAQVFLGSVAGDLLRAASCDVLIVPPGASSA